MCNKKLEFNKPSLNLLKRKFKFLNKPYQELKQMLPYI